MDVSVVVVSYNSSGYLKECLDSIFKFTSGVDFEVIVVDNNSTDDSLGVAKAFGKKITLIANKDNRGFGVGVNIGIQKSTGKFVLVLNPDIRFLDDAISKMMAYMNSHADVGLASCQFFDGEPFVPQGKHKMLPNGGHFPTLARVFFWGFFLDDLPMVANLIKPYHPTGSPLLKTEKYFSNDFFPDWVTGSFMFVRREAIDKVGILDENIFMYGEEVEWQYRMGQAGYKIGYTTSTRVVHYERGSQGGASRLAILGEFRGLKYIYGKHFAGWQQIVLGTFLDVAAALRIVFWLVRRKPETAKIYAEALLI